ncbi:ABC transporter permease [Agrobacterium sp. LAD9]|uniref:ABC transporter permease n=1 Tax=Agrobacterium sp. LAD9 TaxID=2055153 RepID=UPI000D1EEA5F|nr:ABC transporter permease [Agrobacterium sp. LAD9]
MRNSFLAKMFTGRLNAMSFALVLLPIAIALCGPLLAPYSYDEPVGGAGDLPSEAFPLGTDALGRDVLSRVLQGGFSIVGLGMVSTLLAYLPGVAIGLFAGFRANSVSHLLVGIVDMLLVLPSIVLMLVITAGLGPSIPTLLLSVVLVQLPSIARLVRISAAEISNAGYIEVALARGDGLTRILFKEIFPNVSHILLADAGVRFGWSITLITSMNYLGLGLPPPIADWGLMIAENREFLNANPWSVLGPAVLLGFLTIGVSSALDSYTHARGRLTR